MNYPHRTWYLKQQKWKQNCSEAALILRYMACDHGSLTINLAHQNALQNQEKNSHFLVDESC